MRIGFKSTVIVLCVCLSGTVPAATTHYVDVNGANPIPPYTSWATAAANIQDAIDISSDGDQVLVTNGVYNVGGRPVYGALTNRVVIDKAVMVQSVNGPNFTVIQGNPLIGDTAVRCVYLTNGAALTGFTLTQGATRDVQGDMYLEWRGGGAWCESTNATISNCVFSANSAVAGGGGILGGTLDNCILSNNTTTVNYLGGNGGGGALASTLDHCRLLNNSSAAGGGGAESCELNFCVLAGNLGVDGGGALGGTLNNCILTNNSASAGGGAESCYLNNCTIVKNSADFVGGAYGSTLSNCIVYFNQDQSLEGTGNHSDSGLNFCCTTPDPGGNNFTNEPNFVDLANGDLHLQPPSFCINGGDNSTVATSVDLAGNPRIVGAYVDVGAYEFQAAAANPLTVGGIQADYTNAATGFMINLSDSVGGHDTLNIWGFGDGTTVSNQFNTTHSWSTPGDHLVTFTAYNDEHPGGISATITIHTLANPTAYVALNNLNPQPPYDSWATAATNIQDAVNAVFVGGSVVVSNGLYQTGGSDVAGLNRVSITKPLRVQSVNGPAVTIIKGYRMPGVTNGADSVRCVFLTGGSLLSGFTLTNGASSATTISGGGVDCGGSGVIVSNCVLVGNSAKNWGGGGSGGTYYNCIISGNTAGEYGGGVYIGTLNNCLVTSNSAGSSGGGTYSGTVNNCTVIGNYAGRNAGGGVSGGLVRNSIILNNRIGFNFPPGTNVYFATMAYSCTTPLPAGLGNITNAPVFVDATNGDFRLQAASPCINAGSLTYVSTMTDLDGSPRIFGGNVDMGAYEFQSTVRFVSVSNTTPVSPFTNWVTAATNIQDAIDVANAGDFIIVSNGVYQTGGRAVYGAMTNRVAIDKAVTVQSVNGPAVTSIGGLPGTGTYLTSGYRCVYLTNGATLSGFTLTNGTTRNSGHLTNEQSGAAVWCESAAATIVNCVLTHSYANQMGGGAYQGTLNNCVISGNTAFISGGGVYNATLNNCLVITNTLIQGSGGGGAGYGVLNNCLLTRNFAPGGGGGAYFSTLNNCVVSNNIGGFGGGVAMGVANNSLIVSNSTRTSGPGGGAFSNALNNCVIEYNFASGNGGGIYKGTLINCTVVSNTSAISGGGTQGGVLTNCIVYYNTGSGSPNTQDSLLRYSDTIPAVSGSGNITNEPVFAGLAAGDLHLQSNSPCLNAGNNVYTVGATDIDGNPRIAGGTVDMGAYEFQSPASIISYAYLQKYGLPLDGSADNLDADGDGMSNWQEWKAGTVPTNAASVLKLSSPSNSVAGTVITWQSVSGVTYYLLRSTNLPAFTAIQSNIAGQAGSTSYTDSTATNGGRFFYRIGIQ